AVRSTSDRECLCLMALELRKLAVFLSAARLANPVSEQLFVLMLLTVGPANYREAWVRGLASSISTRSNSCLLSSSSSLTSLSSSSTFLRWCRLNSSTASTFSSINFFSSGLIYFFLHPQVRLKFKFQIDFAGLQHL